jgi:peptidoglycan/xylan/chitin deacetylase (PgdA/CDA1 family)
MAGRVKKMGLKMCLRIGRWIRHRGLPVLVYHSIDDSGSYMSTPPAMFRAQVDYLQEKSLRAVSIPQLLEAVDDTGRVAEDVICMTFDDGLRNFADVAWPILHERGFSATVYVPTDFIGRDAAWYRDHGLAAMPCMDWDRLRAVQGQGADVQSHGRSHRALTQLSTTEAQEEAATSRRVLEDEIGVIVEHFAYPYGAQNAEVRDVLRSVGYRSAATLGEGQTPLDGDRLAIKRLSLDRIKIDDVAIARLSMAACVQGSYAWYVAIKGLARRVASFQAARDGHAERLD